jgi:hypothetical protein
MVMQAYLFAAEVLNGQDPTEFASDLIKYISTNNLRIYFGSAVEYTPKASLRFVKGGGRFVLSVYNSYADATGPLQISTLPSVKLRAYPENMTGKTVNNMDTHPVGLRGSHAWPFLGPELGIPNRCL